MIEEQKDEEFHMSKENKFQYTYSAKEQEELKAIREKYLPKEENKMDQIRKLDGAASNKATMHSLLWGITGTLFLGIGMCCTMVWAEQWFLPGIIIGILGIGIAAYAYPVYQKTLKKEHDKIASEILRLTEELID